MSLLLGVAFIGFSLLVLRWLKHWYATRDEAEGLVDNLLVNFVLPGLSGSLVIGAITIVSALYAGVVLTDAAAAAVLSAVVVVAWRWMGRKKPADNVVFLAPASGNSSPPPPARGEVPRRAA